MALKRRTKVIASFSMSSMTDIVFLLLIFFMITSTMVHPNAIKLIIPRKQTKKVVVDKFLNIRINSTGIYYINGKRTTDERLEQSMQKAVAASDNTYIKLNTSGQAPTGKVAKVLDIAETNGIKVVLDIR